MAARLGSATRIDEILQLALAFVARRSSGDRPWTVRAFERATASGLSDVGRIAESMGVAPRTLRRVVVGATGLTPMRHLRIRRLYAAAGRLRDDPDASVGRVAMTCGYADQAHMSRDFSALLGESPTRYRARREADLFKSGG